MFCTKCGVTLPEGVGFCPQCGSATGKSQTQQQSSQYQQAGPPPSFPGQQTYGQQQGGYQQQGAYQQQYYTPPTYPDAEPPRPVVGLWQCYKLFWKNYAKSQGRASRREYWGAYLFHYIFIFVTIIAWSMLLASDESSAVGWVIFAAMMVYVLAMFVPGICITIRRLHDQGKSGMYYFLTFIPYVGGLILFIFTVLPAVNNPSNPWHRDAQNMPPQQQNYQPYSPPY